MAANSICLEDTNGEPIHPIFCQLPKGKVCFNYSHFIKNPFSKESDIIIIDTNNGCNGRGSMVEVLKTLTTLGQGCQFLMDKKSIKYNHKNILFILLISLIK